MTPVVNNKYRYIMFYTPKAACTYLRQLFMNLHAEELSASQRANLHSILDLQKVFPFERGKNYDSYFKFVLVRHPFTRFVSAYLNRIAGEHKECHDRIEQYFTRKYGADYPVTCSFNQTLECFANSPDNYLENVHFLPQSDTRESGRRYSVSTEYCSAGKGMRFIPRLKRLASQRLFLDQVCKTENLQADVYSAYARIFANDPEKMKIVSEYLAHSPMANVSLADATDVSNAADLDHRSIFRMPKKPAYANFLSEDVCRTLARKYKADFELFDYSEEFQAVLVFEEEKNRRLRNLIPADFDARYYLDSNPDLGANGLKTEQDAILHWVHHGHQENRIYKRGG